MKSYNCVVDDPDFWGCWPKTNTNMVGKSSVDPDKLRELALEAGWRDMDTLNKVYNDLSMGHILDVKGNTGKVQQAPMHQVHFKMGNVLLTPLQSGYIRDMLVAHLKLTKFLREGRSVVS